METSCIHVQCRYRAFLDAATWYVHVHAAFKVLQCTCIKVDFVQSVLLNFTLIGEGGILVL